VTTTNTRTRHGGRRNLPPVAHVHQQIATEILTQPGRTTTDAYNPETLDIAALIANAQCTGALIFAHAFTAGYASGWRRRATAFRYAGATTDAEHCEVIAAALDHLADTYNQALTLLNHSTTKETHP
jgi:hypothetical protein